MIALALVACGRIGFDPAASTDGAGGSGSGSGSGVDAPVESGLLVHFTFDVAGDPLHDSGPAHHDGTCFGACPSLIAGRVGAGAVHVDGTQCISVPDGADLRPAIFTIALWLEGESGDTISNDVMARPLQGATTNNNTWEILYKTPSTLKGGLNPSFLTTSVSGTAWHHFALVYDGAKQRIFLDGVAAGTFSSAGPAMYDAGDNDLIGCDFNTGAIATPFFGGIDDVRIYDRVLTAGELSALAQAL